MLKRSLVIRALSICALAVFLSLELSAQSQTPSAPSAATSTTVHFEGCVFPERAVSSNPPYIVPAGSAEDFLLTNTRAVSGSEPGTEDPGVMYKLEQVTLERLSALTGKRVGVTGRIEKEPELPAFQVVSIREISGWCPNRPGQR